MIRREGRNFRNAIASLPRSFQTLHPDLKLPLLFKKVDSESGSFMDTVALASPWLFGLKFQRFLQSLWRFMLSLDFREEEAAVSIC